MPRLVPSPVNPAWMIPEGWESVLGARTVYRIGNSSLRLFRVQLNQHPSLADDTEVHSHTHHQLLFYRTGTGLQRVNGVDHRVEPGVIFFLPAGCQHSFHGHPGESVVCLAIDFQVVEAEPLQIENALGGDEEGVLFSLLHAGEVLPFRLQSTDQRQVQNCIAEILVENERRETGFSVLIQASLLRLIAFCLRATQRAEGFQTHFRHTTWRHRLISERVLALLRARACEPDAPGLAEAARLCASSPNQLNRILRKHCGETYTQLLLQERLKRAKNLIEEGKHNCTEAAFEAGFTDSNYFTRMFRKQYGMPPSSLLPRG